MHKMADKSEVRSFAKPDELTNFPKGMVELVNIGGAAVGRATLQPGWRWSTCVQPIAQTEHCEAPHFQYQLAGTLHVQLVDGTEFESKAGDVILLTTGHDAWVVGEEPVVVVDFQGLRDYGKPA